MSKIIDIIENNDNLDKAIDKIAPIDMPTVQSEENASKNSTQDTEIASNTTNTASNTTNTASNTDRLDFTDITKLYSDVHISVWDTRNVSTGSSASNQIKLPIATGVASQDFRILWSDGSSWQTITDGINAIHTYDIEGIYTITIIGTVNGFQFNNNGDKLKITEIKSWGKSFGLNVESFTGCSNLVVINATDLPYLSNSMERTFQETSITKITNIDLWDTSKITNFFLLFYSTAFNQDISSWDTSSVTDMSNTFYRTTAFNQDISSWDTSSVTKFSAMFAFSVFNQDLSSWDIGKATTMSNIFQETPLSSTNYKSMIKSWAKQGGWFYNDWTGRNDEIQQNVPAHFGSASLTGDLEALDAKAFLVATYALGGYGWVITDGTI